MFSSPPSSPSVSPRTGSRMMMAQRRWVSPAWAALRSRTRRCWASCSPCFRCRTGWPPRWNPFPVRRCTRPASWHHRVPERCMLPWPRHLRAPPIGSSRRTFPGRGRRNRTCTLWAPVVQTHTRVSSWVLVIVVSLQATSYDRKTFRQSDIIDYKVWVDGNEPIFVLWFAVFHRFTY